jgi:hypothetical protein
MGHRSKADLELARLISDRVALVLADRPPRRARDPGELPDGLPDNLPADLPYELHAEFSDGFNELIKYRLGLCRIHRSIERRPPPFAGRGGDGEIAHQQHRAQYQPQNAHTSGAQPVEE